MSWIGRVLAGAPLTLVALAALGCPSQHGAETHSATRPSIVPWAPRGVALSLFESSSAGCAWRTVELPTLRWRTLAVVPGGSCRGARLALSGDQRHAAVWFDTSPANATHGGPGSPLAGRSEPAVPARLFLIDEGREGGERVEGNAPRPVPLPADTADLGFDAQGRVVALTLQGLSDAEIDHGEALVDGRPVKLVPASGGDPVLAHAFAFDGARWTRFETVNSTTSWDLGLGTGALDAAADLGFRSSEVLVPFIQGDDEIDPQILAALGRFAPQVHGMADEKAWIRFGSGATWFEVWEQSGEFAFATGLAAFLDARGKPVKPEAWPFSEKDILSYSWNGPYLLARIDVEGTHPRLYQNGHLMWFSDQATAATFWPDRGAPQSRH